jgi:hypothetical protein
MISYVIAAYGFLTKESINVLGMLVLRFCML